MYKNLQCALKDKKITYKQVAELLNCQLRTVSEKIDGSVQAGFSIDDALLIKKVFLPEYDIAYLFDRSEKAA